MTTTELASCAVVPAASAPDAASQPPIMGLATVKRAAQCLSISQAKLYTMMDRGEMPYLKIGKARRIPWQAIADFIQKNTVARA